MYQKLGICAVTCFICNKMPSPFIFSASYRTMRPRKLLPVRHFTLQSRQSTCTARGTLTNASMMRCSAGRCSTIRLKIQSELPSYVPTQKYKFVSSASNFGSTTNDESKSKEPKNDITVDHNDPSAKSNAKNIDETNPASDIPHEPLSIKNHDQSSNPSFKVSRVSYKTGAMYVTYRHSVCLSPTRTS